MEIVPMNGFKISIFLILLLCPPPPPPLLADDKTILIIESYHPVLAWTAQCEEAISDTLSDVYRIDHFYMDTKRIPASQFEHQAKRAWQTFLDKKPDLVMLGDDDALRLLGPRFTETDVPVVYFGINSNPRNYFDKLPENMTGVLERTPVIPWLRFLKAILPKADSALLLMDDSPTSHAISSLVFQEKDQLIVGGITTQIKLVGTFEEWQRTITGTGNHDFVLIPTFHSLKDRHNNPVSIRQVIEWTSANSTVPVFSNQDYTVDDLGVTGAYAIYGKAHGKLAAEIALMVLEDKKLPSQITPQTDNEGAFYFNKKQLARFRLNLPEEIQKQATFK